MNHLLPLKSRIRRYARSYKAQFSNGFSVDTHRTIDIAGRATPVLMHGDAELNMNYAATDTFTERTGVTTSIFVRKGDDFIRITTSIKNQKNERAVGTLLDRAHPGYARLLQGQSYLGLSSVFGVQLMTGYDPIRDSAGRVIGVIVVGMAVVNKFYNGLGFKLTAALSAGATLLLCLYGWAFSALSGAALSRALPADEAHQASAALHASFSNLALVGLGGVLLLAVGMYPVLQRLVSKPLIGTRYAAEKLAAGDLTSLVHVDRRDEIGQLMHAVNATAQGLARIVGDVRQASDSITHASREIADGNADLSARTESQASALEQAASSMGQLTDIVKLSADKARQVDGHVAAASQVAGHGEKVVGDVVQTMQAIKRSSLKVADIVGVIDGIAFQTNLLALNAAVEAARAGEHGRGFAVVAAEVRSLAHRSASAAKEIKTLINDSVGSVDAGGKLVEEAGSTMIDIMSAVHRVSDAMSEITKASEEQRAGIEEINTAIAHIDDMTQRNSALVEEAAAAAESTYDSAVKLSSAVTAFKLAGS
ncbi:methyl-accepting chemotaxis protein-2 (aspartate sensor receptor) [Paucimonas lemoignei]|uniref:Methyl-accepting chemotaxis protein-2 (Aspartate sensor receptor) n=1 Tax=Paucimonas lemoignei TaxID=29443 RepID=A0A4R3I067_PAULE|nr:methyl-accepting chemotaxis protein [Paucimonas lemoignei]TCS38031.1 methyl-accepting chemotaxis protein-2 (aspartate sensor receptor) [Paucimonas lemoignei]